VGGLRPGQLAGGKNLHDKPYLAAPGKGAPVLVGRCNKIVDIENVTPTIGEPRTEWIDATEAFDGTSIKGM
jgi:hypothetical protein